MPTLEELGQKVKAKYPQYAEIPDGELGAKVKAKYPDAYKDYAAAESTFDKMKAKHDKAEMEIFGSASKSSTDRYNKAMASATQDIKNYYSRAAGETAAMIPAAVAAPLTAGASVPAAMGIMGLAGIGGGLLREGTKKVMGSSEVPKGADLALVLGVDGLMGAGGEGLGRGLVVGKTLLPKLLERAAVKSATGKALLEEQYAGIRSQLDGIVGKRPVDVEKSIVSAYKELDALPKGKGAFGEQFTGLTAKAEETASNIAGGMQAKQQAAKLTKNIGKAQARQAQLEGVTSGVRAGDEISQRGRDIIKQMEDRLEIVNGKISSHQPLDALIEIKGNAQQMAWGDSTNVRERPIFRRMAEDLDRTIKQQLKGNPEAAALYEQANDKAKTLFQQKTATKMAEKFINSYAGRLAGGATLGAGAGTYYGRSPGAAATGAAVGAGIAVGTPKLATLILQQTAAHPEAAKALSRGLDFALRGDTRTAKEMAERAFAMAGVRETIKEALKQQGE